jgi:hypothetical protein
MKTSRNRLSQRLALVVWFWIVRVNMAVAKLYTNSVSKSPAKAQRPKENSLAGLALRLPLRLCAFAGEIFFTTSLLLIAVNVANAGTEIKVVVLPSADITVEANLSTPSRSWSFRNAYAGILGLGDRVHDFRAATASGQDASAQRLATGEFRSALDATKITYKVKITTPTPADVSHASWLASNRAFLMFADLIPRDLQTLAVEFTLPDGWTVESAISRDSTGRYQLSEPETAVFFVGQALRKTSTTLDGMPLDLVLSGPWSFKDRGALKAGAKVLKKYAALTGFRLPSRSTIMIAPLPVAVGNTSWRAETRGSTVVLLIDPAADFKNWIGQLSVIFTHELLHLWIPNSLHLDGDYDWFFEGFTLYTALRTALELKLIDFKEFLNTLARVYDSYVSYRDDSSLIDASERRWTTPGSFVYDKGMLVAFLYDLLVRSESAGKITLADRYRQLFSSRAAEHADGNEAIIAVLGSSPAAKEFARGYIESSAKIELERLLPAYGLTLDSSGTSSQLRTSGELNSDQKRLLRSLGYRN